MWIWKERKEINSEEWDHYLDQSREPFVEFSSWYLDICCKYWGAFFHLEKNWRIPIPYSNYLGLIKKTTRPPFLQRLKIISDSTITQLEIKELFNQIKLQFRCGVLNWDYEITGSRCRSNYILDNNTNKYHLSQKRNLNKVNLNQLKFIESQHNEDLFLWLKNNGEDYHYEKEFNNDLFKSLVKELLYRKKGFILFALSQDDITTGAAVYSNYKGRKVFLISFNTSLGKKNGGMAGIINFTQSHLMSTTDILDLEGSDIPGIAKFYEGFGAQHHYYYEIVWNDNFLCKLKKLFRK